MKWTSLLIKGLSLIAVQKVLVDAAEAGFPPSTKEICDFTGQEITTQKLQDIGSADYTAFVAKTIKLSKNQITDLPQDFAAIMGSETKRLDLSQNLIGSGGFGLFENEEFPFEQLDFLNIARNKVTNVNSLSLPKSLTQLTMNSNKIERDVHFKQYPDRLQSLSARGCGLTFDQIIGMEWGFMSHLTTLEIDGNTIPTDLDETNLLEFKLPKSLTRIIVDAEFLLKIIADDDYVADLPNLASIAVRYPSQADLASIADATLQKMCIENEKDFQLLIHSKFKKNGEALVIGFVSGSIADFTGLNLDYDALVAAGTFVAEKKEVLRIQRSELTGIPKRFVSGASLKNVDLPQNKLYSIGIEDFVNSLVNCEVLNLAGNKLGDFGKMKMPQTLRTLNLNGNKPYTIKFARAPANLKVLKAQNMGLSMGRMAMIEFEKMPNLKELYIDGNYNDPDFNKWQGTIGITDLQMLEKLRIDWFTLVAIMETQDLNMPALKKIILPARSLTGGGYTLDAAQDAITAFFGPDVVAIQD